MKIKNNALIAFILIVAAIFFAPLILGKMPFEVCLFHKFTGWPCPFCGGTRSLVALGKLEFKQALLMNPLVIFICLGALFLLPAQIFSEKTSQVISKWPWGKFFLILILLNWIYLVRFKL